MKRTFFARYGFIIILMTVFLMPFILVGTIRALRTNRNDVKDWLPDTFRETAVHTWFNEHFPHEQFVLASWDGCTLDDPRLEMLAGRLERYDADLEDLGIKGQPAEVLRKHGLDSRKVLLEHEALIADLVRIGSLSEEEARGLLQKAEQWKSPFKSPVLTGKRLVDMLQGRYQDLSEEEVLARLEGSIIGEDHRKTCLVVTLSDAAKGNKLRGTLETIRKLARQCGIEPELPRPEGNLLVRAFDRVVGTVGEMIYGRTPKNEGLRLGGPPVDNVAIDVEGERTLYRLAALSAIVGLGISWLCFRSVRLTFLVFFTAILAAGASLAILYFTSLFIPWATVDAIMLSMPSLVYVLAISAGIHIINYYHDAIHEKGLVGAPERALGHGFWPCTIAAFTTAVGLGSLCVSHVIPISKFGIFSAAGVMVTLLLIFLFLPACLYFFPSRKYDREHGSHRDDVAPETRILKFWRRFGGGIIRHHTAVALACTLAMVFFGYWVFQIKTSIKLMKLFSPDAQIIADYAWLEDQLGPLVPMEIVVHVDNQKCPLSFVDRMRMVQYVEGRIEAELEDVGGALSAATFAPDISPDHSRVIGINAGAIRDRILNERLEDHRKDFSEYLRIDREVAVAGHDADPWLEDMGVRGPVIDKLRERKVDTLSAIQQHGDLSDVPGISPEEAARVRQTVDAWMKSHRDPTLAELGLADPLAGRLKAKGLTTLLAIEHYGSPEKPLADNLRSIPGVTAEEARQVARSVERWRVDHGEELWRITARVRALSDLDYGVFVSRLKEVVEPILDQYQQAGVEGIDATYTGLVPLVYKTQHELMRSLFNSLAMAFALIAVVMMVVLKNPLAGLLAMLPNLFPVVIIFGFMGWMRVLVDIGTMMTASVALGVAVDDTIHYLSWFRHGLDDGRDRKGAAMFAYERCATAMTQTTLIGGLGLAAFAFSTFTPTQRFGLMMLTLLAVALVGDLIYLPSLLTGPLGRIFRQRPGPKARPAEDGASAEAGEDENGNGSDDEVISVPLSAKPRATAPRRSHKAS